MTVLSSDTCTSWCAHPCDIAKTWIILNLLRYSCFTLTVSISFSASIRRGRINCQGCNPDLTLWTGRKSRGNVSETSHVWSQRTSCDQSTHRKIIKKEYQQTETVVKWPTNHSELYHRYLICIYMNLQSTYMIFLDIHK